MALVDLNEIKGLTQLYLGVTLPVPAKELRSAYAAACRRLHPDRESYENSSNVEEFRRMNNLYKILRRLVKDPDVARYIVKE